jgi:hypothetical protein
MFCEISQLSLPSLETIGKLDRAHLPDSNPEAIDHLLCARALILATLSNLSV